MNKICFIIKAVCNGAQVLMVGWLVDDAVNEVFVWKRSWPNSGFSWNLPTRNEKNYEHMPQKVVYQQRFELGTT